MGSQHISTKVPWSRSPSRCLHKLLHPRLLSWDVWAVERCQNLNECIIQLQVACISHISICMSLLQNHIQVNELPFFSAETLDGQQNYPGIQSWKKMRNVTFSLRRSEGTVPRLHSHVRYHIDQPIKGDTHPLHRSIWKHRHWWPLTIA